MPTPPLFLDTAFIYAVINPNDQWHTSAVKWQKKVVSSDISLITTQFILAEIADGLSAIRYRASAAEIIHKLSGNPQVEIVLASADLFDRGLELYESRADKTWGLTDCFSFIAMWDNRSTDALTTDDHFGQAGFNTLLLGEP